MGIGAYIDDLYIFTDTFEEHVFALEQLFKRLIERNFTVNPKKCQLFQEKVSLLGFEVTSGVEP